MPDGAKQVSQAPGAAVRSGCRPPSGGAAVLLSLPSTSSCWHNNMTQHINLSGSTSIRRGLHR